MKPKLLFAVVVALSQVAALSCAEEKKIRPKPVSVDVHIRTEWLLLPPSLAGPDSNVPVVTRSALRTLRAVDPNTAKPYDDSNDIFGCNPADLRRTFRLEKKEFLLGEPILVDFRIELHGPGCWREPMGGNYRSRGRDDNFLFLMRHADQTWVRDTYTRASGFGGGLSSSYRVTQNEPRSYWLAVQRWCAIDRPGTYDLYCFQVAHEDIVLGHGRALIAGMPDEIKNHYSLNPDGGLMDSKTAKPSQRHSIVSKWQTHKWDPSPLIEHIPPDVVAHAEESWPVQSAMDFVHFKIVITEPSATERQHMIKYWTKVAESSRRRALPTVKARAARQAICFAQQDDFLPLINKWITTASQPSDFYGLAMRPNPEATAMLLRVANPDAVSAMRHLHPDRIPDVIPQLIKWLTHEDNRIRADSEMLLREWTGQAFCHTWNWYHYQRPTLEEARKMQPLWRQWWDKNKKGFKPKTR